MAKSITYLKEAYTGANFTGDAVKISDYGGPLKDGLYSAYVWGNLGGGTVTIYVSPDDGDNWFIARARDGVTDQAIFTAADVRTVCLKGTHVSCVLTGSAGAVALNVGIAR